MTSGIKTYPFPKGLSSFRGVEKYLGNLVADLEEDQMLQARDISPTGIVPIMTPVSGSTSGKPGDLAQDTNNIYVCTAPDTWKSIPLQTFGSSGGVPTIVKSGDISSSFTWDGTYQTADFTTGTSATAQWIILSIWFIAASSKSMYFAPTVNYLDAYGPAITLTSTLYQVAPSNAWKYSGTTWIPLGSSQTVVYVFPSECTSTNVRIIGYI